MTKLLEIEDLHIAVAGEGEEAGNAIVKGFSLAIEPGELHAVMGPNGAGKSTLASALAGRPDYEITRGSVRYKGKDLLAMEPHERAGEGIFLGFQYPVEIPGVSNLNFMRSALNAQRRYRGEEELDAGSFMKRAKEKAKMLGMSADMLKRFVNVGFSGGEKKRNEMVQLAVFDPTLAILDETDSGLDIDALKIVAEGINSMRSDERGMLVITHYQRLLDHVVPDKVHAMVDGRLVRSGGPELARELEEKGYQAVA